MSKLVAGQASVKVPVFFIIYITVLKAGYNVMIQQNNRQTSAMPAMPDDFNSYQIKPAGRNNQSWLAISPEGKPAFVLKAADFFADARVAGWLMKIQHAGLPRCLGRSYIDDLEQECFVFEYLPGKSLGQFIKTDRDTAALILLAVKICRLLIFLRCLPGCEIWHLDLKPDNIVVNDQLEPALIDFASSCMVSSDEGEHKLEQEISKVHDNAEVEKPASDIDGIAGPLSCTPVFAAPEMLTGRPHRSSDLYSLAATCLLLFANNSAGSSISITELMRSAVPEAADVLADYLQSDPVLRPQRPEQMASDLALAAAKIGQDGLLINWKQKIDVKKYEIDQENEATKTHANDSLKPCGSSARVICIWDSAEMACETAAYIAKSGQEVLLIDSEWLDSRSDLLLGIKNIAHSGIRDVFTGNLDNALTAAFDNLLDDNRLRSLAQPTQIENLYLMAPSGDYEMYEDDLASAYCRLIETARNSFSNIVISVGSYFYDELVCYSLSLSDFVIVAIKGFNESIRAQGRAMSFLCHKKIIAENRIRMAVFDYRIESDLSRGTISQLCQYPVIGYISENKLRRKQKNASQPYTSRLSKRNTGEYKSMLARLEHNGQLSCELEVV
jgi:serine/threonine protein kinase